MSRRAAGTLCLAASRVGGLAVQERRVYLHDYVLGADGAAAWREIGDELKALRSDPQAVSLLPIDYDRYLPIAQRILHDFYNNNDAELIPAVRLVGPVEGEIRAAVSPPDGPRPQPIFAEKWRGRSGGFMTASHSPCWPT